MAETPSWVDIVSEVADLVMGVGIMVLPLMPFALPALALIMLAGLLLLVPALVGGLLLTVLALPIFVLRRWVRSRPGRAATRPGGGVVWPLPPPRRAANGPPSARHAQGQSQ